MNETPFTTKIAIDHSDLFYEIMNYPKPAEEIMKFLSWGKRDDHSLLQTSFQYSPDQCNLFSRDEPPSHIHTEYIEHINATSSIRRHIPYITHVYLANSITFNALHEQSDIDVLIIVQPWKMRIARLLSWFILWIRWLSRIHKRTIKKYCLSFYLERSPKSNLYPLLLQPLDLYMIFWIAHLVPVYTVSLKDSDYMWRSNTRIKSYLPNHPLKQIIRIGNELFLGKSRIKELWETLFNNRFWKLVNTLISIIRKPFLYYKKKMLGKKWWWIIIDNQILKFHLDRRKSIILQYLNVIKKYKTS